MDCINPLLLFGSVGMFAAAFRERPIHRSHCSFFRRVLSRIILFFLIILCIEFLICCNALLNPPSIRHYKLNYAVIYAKFILRHTSCIRHKNCKHIPCINSFSLRTFFRNLIFLYFWSVLLCFMILFWVRSLFEFYFWFSFSLNCFLRANSMPVVTGTVRKLV